MAWLVASDEFDVVLGSRILGTGALAGGMPLYKYVSNRLLTAVENLLLGVKLSEYHTGYRAFRREVLQTLPLEENSDDFVFDNQMLAQAVAFGYRIGEISCPTKYFPEASSINFHRSVIYGSGGAGHGRLVPAAPLGAAAMPAAGAGRPAPDDGARARGHGGDGDLSGHGYHHCRDNVAAGASRRAPARGGQSVLFRPYSLLPLLSLISTYFYCIPSILNGQPSQEQLECWQERRAEGARSRRSATSGPVASPRGSAGDSRSGTRLLPG